MKENSTKKETTPTTEKIPPSTNPINEDEVSMDLDFITKNGELSKDANEREIMRVFKGLEDKYKVAVASVIPDRILVDELSHRLVEYGDHINELKKLIGRF